MSCLIATRPGLDRLAIDIETLADLGQDSLELASPGPIDGPSVALDLRALREMAEGHVREVRDNVQEFEIGRKRLHLVAEGRLVNLGAAEGHPAAVMDMSFANQALSAEYVVKHGRELEKRVYVVPEAIDAEVATAISPVGADGGNVSTSVVQVGPDGSLSTGTRAAVSTARTR